MCPETRRHSTGTTVSAALVLKCDFEIWPDAKRALESLGVTIVYQKVGPPFARFEIVEAEPHEVRP